MKSWESFRSDLNRTIKEIGQGVVDESKVQYYSTCPDCKKKYITDEGHLCSKYKKTKREMRYEKGDEHTGGH